MKKLLLVAIFGATAMAAAGSIAWAAIPDASGVIHACVKKNGDVTLIDTETGERCIEQEVER